MKKNSPKHVCDTHLIEVEYYNPNKFDIEVTRDDRYLDYIISNKIPIGPAKTILKSENWLVLPHSYIIFKSINGPELFNLTVNMGDLKRKGNKLPSLPIYETK